MKKLILASMILLAACAHDGETGLAKKPIIPDLPTKLSQKATRLPDLKDPSMGALVLDGSSTDTIYNDVATRFNAVIDIYNCVKNTMNLGGDPEECFR